MSAAAEQAAAQKIVEEQERIAAAAARASQQFQQNWIGGLNSLAGAGAGLGQVLSAVKVLGAENEDIAALAENFVRMQATIQLLQGGYSTLNNLNEGLGKLQMAASAAQTQLALTGGSATVTQAALLRLAVE